MLRFAVIGVGRMGLRHAFNLYRGFVGGVKLVAVCDIDQKALDKCKKIAPRAAAYIDYKEMIRNERLDGVIIATPHYSHGIIAIYCIENGINTLVEKPLCVTVKEASEVAKVALGHPELKVGVSYNQRSNRMYRKAKSIIESGTLGEITRVNFIITDWYRSQAYYDQGGWRATYNGEGGGCLINQCIHQLDILQWLVGMPKKIYALDTTVNRNITVENDVAAVFDYGSFKGLFSASTHELKGVNRLEISFDKGRIVIGTLSMKIYRHKSERKVNAETKFGYGFSPSTKKICGYGFFRLIADIIFGQQLRSVRAFARAIKGKGELLASCSEGINAPELINAIYLSSWKAEPVILPIDGEIYETALEDKRREERK